MEGLTHKHIFKLSIHMDGCHFYANTYACQCGAGLSLSIERNFKRDPYSYVWTEGSDCIRCRELEAGGRRMPYVMMLVEPGKNPRRIWHPELKKLIA